MAAQAPLLIQSIKDVTIAHITSRQLREVAEIEAIADKLYDLVDDGNVTKLIVDFSRVQVVSSHALGVLMKLREKVARTDGKLVLCGVNPNLRQLLKLAQLTKLFLFSEDEAGGLALFGVTSAG